MTSREHRLEIRELRKVVQEQKARIAELEAELAALKIIAEPSPPNDPQRDNSDDISDSTDRPRYVPTREELTNVVNLIAENKFKSIRSASEATGIGRNKLSVALKRFKAGKDVYVERGRRLYWNKAMDDILTAKLNTLTREGAAALYVCYQRNRTKITFGILQPELVQDSIENLIYTIHNNVLKEELGRELYGKESKLCSYRTLLKIIKNEKFRTLVATAKTDRQNERRREAIADAYNFVCLAVQAVILFPSNYSQSLVFNYDKTSVPVYLEDESRAVYSAQAEAELQEINQNITMTEDSRKTRTIGLGVLTAANGALTKTVIYLKDEKFNGFPAYLMKLTGKNKVNPFPLL